MRHRFLLCLVALTLWLGCAGPAEEASVEPAADALAEEIPGLMEKGGIPGLSTAVVRDGEIAWSRTTGVGHAESGEPVSPETLFEAASLSKPVFATIVLRMAERGEWDLDQPLHELLPYERIDHDPRSRQLTARLVLSHQTGLPNWGGEKLDFAFAPGERFGYSGEGYVYLQQAVEKVTGLTLEELARREVFEPLAMARSRFSWPEGETLPLATGHDEIGQPQEKREPHEGNAAASLHTTAEEFARFVLAWMDASLLSGETLAAALTPQVHVSGDDVEGEGGPVEEGRIGWGLGWGLQLPPQGTETGSAAEPDDPIAFHWGDNGPFKAFVAFRPRERSGVVYFANSTNGLAIARAVTADVVGDMAVTLDMLGYESFDAPGRAERIAGRAAEAAGDYAAAIAHFEAALEAAPDDEETGRRIEWLGDLVRVAATPVAAPEEAMERYAGRYGPRTLAVEDGELTYQRDGGEKYRLIPLAEKLFALEGLVMFRLEVVTDETGAPLKLVGHYVQGRTDESERTPG